ncbi:protein translocase subunit TIM44 [Ascoidea rubescens DSM 1968]|uniref:Mitochondrial import inner membrane translocase subunit TIM44 n=1 Tax=Ascoidea rubescens DSM 1968 TaxID=1344418 RepID=A0A1D2VBD9_9ASCO|nr:peripheral mitochondrial membrane protein [Ascoidea rubescens DSM 1968]ODV58783.1 peripheral mitochondrial membrane protein [Ascoidea rubescens DSM 1968]
MYRSSLITSKSLLNNRLNPIIYRNSIISTKPTSIISSQRFLHNTSIIYQSTKDKSNTQQNQNQNQNKTHNSNSNAPPQSPISVFFQTFKQEWAKNEQLKDDIKALQDETGRMSESEAFKKAREALEKAQKGTTVVGKTLKKTGEVVGDAAVKAWESEAGKTTRKVVSKTAKAIDDTIEPVRQTKIYKDVSEVIDDGDSSAYGGFIDKKHRREKREMDFKSGKKHLPIKSKDDVGNALVNTDYKVSTPTFGEKWENFKITSPVGKVIADLRLRWDESDNGLVSIVRTIFEKISGFFTENENARVIKSFRLMDPTFKIEEFQKNLREYVLPEILDAYVKGDEKVLKTWLSEAPFNVWNASTKQYKEKGSYSDGRVLDIRGVDIVSAKLLPPANVPCFVVGCRAQEIHLFKDIKTNEVTAGTESNIQLSTYAIVFTRLPENMDDKETEGWKVLEFVRAGSRSFT